MVVPICHLRRPASAALHNADVALIPTHAAVSATTAALPTAADVAIFSTFPAAAITSIAAPAVASATILVNTIAVL